MDRVSARELQATARVVDGLVYAAGLAGVVAGALLLRDGAVAFAVIAWVLTFIAGALLRLAAAGARALSQLMITGERIQTELEAAGLDRAGSPPSREAERGGHGGTGTPDPWRRWGGWH